MVAGKVRIAMGLQKSPSSTNNKPPPPPSPCPSSGGKPHKTSAFTRSFGAYFPRASAQVQPRPPDVVSELLSLVEDLRERESRLKTELVEQKLLRQTAAIVPLLEADIVSKGDEIHRLLNKIRELEAENEKLVHEREVIKAEFDAERRERDAKIVKLEAEIDEARQLSASQRMVVKNSSFRKMAKGSNDQGPKLGESESMRREKEEIIPVVELERPSHSRCNSDEIAGISGSAFSAIVVRSRVPRVPKPPPPKRSSSDSSLFSLRPPPPPPPPVKSGAPPPPPPPPPGKCGAPPPPPPPPPPQKRAPLPFPAEGTAAKVKRVPEVVEFYHSLMRRDSRRDAGAGTAETTAANAKDLVGEIENRSSYLLAIKTDVETQGDFIRFLIKEVETASFTDIEDVISFVKWLDDELSYLVDERAVLKHFNWPEQKADALREAAFEYSDLKKLEFEASSFRVDARQTACSSALKKMQTLLEKLEHAAYNLSRLRESASNRFKSFHIPVDWMLDTGFVSQIKLASVKLAMKYMKRVSVELEAVGGFPDEEELIVQGVRFAFRVHQFAGGFDVETMRAFEELRDKARSCHIQCQNQQQQQQQSQRPVCRSMPC